jgi:hypothetical protein
MQAIIIDKKLAVYIEHAAIIRLGPHCVGTTNGDA